MYVSVSFSPWGLVILPSLFIFLMKWPKRYGSQIVENSRVGIFRRLAAVYVDAFVGLIGALPFISMTALTTEFFATGQWQWSYERDFVRPTDIIDVLVFFIDFYGIFYHVKWHFDRQRPTVGQQLFKFRLVPAHKNPRMGIRAFVAWVNLAWWPIWPWTIMQHKQDYWWDTASGIKARRVEES